MKLKEKIKNNKKIEKLKQYHESFKILWNDPKSHAIIMLSFWFILILLLALVVRLNNNQPTEIKTEPIIQNQEPTNQLVKDQLLNINSYEANIVINTPESTEQLIKTYINDEELITYNNQTFYYKDMLYILDNNQLIETTNDLIQNTKCFNTKNIYELIKDKTEEYITIYKDNAYIINYQISINQFLQNYNNTNLETEEYINITINGKEQINQIQIDLTSIQNINSFYISNITIEFNNINNIENIKINNTEGNTWM